MEAGGTYVVPLMRGFKLQQLLLNARMAAVWLFLNHVELQAHHSRRNREQRMETEHIECRLCAVAQTRPGSVWAMCPLQVVPKSELRPRMLLRLLYPPKSAALYSGQFLASE